jgi:hypothetical protein
MNDVRQAQTAAPSQAADSDSVSNTGRFGELRLALSRRGLVATLWAIPLIIFGLGLVQQAYVKAFGENTALGTLRPLSLYDENCLADWYGFLLMAFAAVLIAVTGYGETRARWKPYWYVLAAIFAYLSIDESVGLHEMFMTLMAPFHFTGALTYSWVVPYGAACIILGLIYLPFVVAQPEPLRRQLVLAGAFFLASALGLELVEGYCGSRYEFGRCYMASMMTEEFGEMLGLTILVTALIAYLRRRYRSISITL